MIIVSYKFWQKSHHLFNPFNEVYMFGLALEKEYPQDIDLVLVYSGDFSIGLKQSCNAIRDSVFQQFYIEAHLTVLSVSEKTETKFLEMIKPIQLYPL